MTKLSKILIVFGSILLTVLIIFAVLTIIEQEKEKKEYGECLQVFADEYCGNLNYSRAIYWGNGWNEYLYFKCASERDYEGYGQFISTDEEKKYCKIEVYNGDIKDD